MAGIEGLYDGVVAVVPGGVFVAGRDAVSGDHRAVEDFVRVNESRERGAEVSRVEIGVVQQSLGDIHADVDDLREIRVLLALFKSVALFEYRDFVGLRAVLFRAAGKIDAELQSGFAERSLVEVLLKVFCGFDREDDVVRL